MMAIKQQQKTLTLMIMLGTFTEQGEGKVGDLKETTFLKSNYWDERIP